MMLSICSCADLPSVYLLWWNIYLNLCPHLKNGLFDYFFSSESDRRSGRQILFQMCVSQIFLQTVKLAFHLLYRICLKISVQNFLMKSIALIISRLLCICTLSKKSLPRRHFIACSYILHLWSIASYFCLWYKVKFNVLFSLPLDILLFQDHLLKSLSFFIELPWHLCWNQLSIQGWVYFYCCVAKWSILFDWVTCQSLCQQVCWELQLAVKSQNRVVWILCFLFFQIELFWL